MADLHVNTDGLASAALAGDDIAAGLVAADAGAGCQGGRQGHAGVEAMDAAMASIRERQSTRAAEFAGALRVSTGSYLRTDTGSADTITRSI